MNLETALEAARTREMATDGLADRARATAHRHQRGRRLAAAGTLALALAATGALVLGTRHTTAGRVSILSTSPRPDAVDGLAGITLAGDPATPPVDVAGPAGILLNGTRWASAEGHVAVSAQGSGRWEQWPVPDLTQAGLPADSVPDLTVVSTTEAVGVVTGNTQQTYALLRTSDAGQHWLVEPLTDIPGTLHDGLRVAPVLDGATLVGLAVSSSGSPTGAGTPPAPGLFVLTPDGLERRPLPLGAGDLTASDGVLWDVGTGGVQRSVDVGATWQQVSAAGVQLIGPAFNGGVYVVTEPDGVLVDGGYVETVSRADENGVHTIAADLPGNLDQLRPYGPGLAEVDASSLSVVDELSGLLTVTPVTGLGGTTFLQGLQGDEALASSCSGSGVCTPQESHDGGRTWTPAAPFTAKPR